MDQLLLSIYSHKERKLSINSYNYLNIFLLCSVPLWVGCLVTGVDTFIFLFLESYGERNEFNMSFSHHHFLSLSPYYRSEIFRSFLCNVNSCDVWNVWVDGKREREEGEEGGREKKEGGREKREGGEVGIRFFLFTLVCKFST